MPIAPSPELPPTYDVIVDQPFADDKSQLELALGVQALIVRALWAADLEASPASEEDPAYPGQLVMHRRARPPGGVLAGLHAAGFATRHLLQLGIGLSTQGFFVEAYMIPADRKDHDGVPLAPNEDEALHFGVMDGACDMCEALGALLEFVIDAACPELDRKTRDACTDPYGVWGVDDPGVLVASLCTVGSGLRVLMPIADDDAGLDNAFADHSRARDDERDTGLRLLN